MGETRNYHSPKAEPLGSWGRAKLGGLGGEKHANGVLVGRVDGVGRKKARIYNRIDLTVRSALTGRIT